MILLIAVGLFFGICGLEFQCFKSKNSTCEFNKDNEIESQIEIEKLSDKGNKTLIEDKIILVFDLNKTN